MNVWWLSKKLKAKGTSHCKELVIHYTQRQPLNGLGDWLIALYCMGERVISCSLFNRTDCISSRRFDWMFCINSECLLSCFREGHFLIIFNNVNYIFYSSSTYGPYTRHDPIYFLLPSSIFTSFWLRVNIISWKCVAKFTARHTNSRPHSGLENKHDCRVNKMPCHQHSLHKSVRVKTAKTIPIERRGIAYSSDAVRGLV